MRFINGLALLVVLAFGVQANAAPVVIDDFTDGDADLTTDTNDALPSFVNQAGVGDVIGSGDRNLTVFQVTPPASTSSQDSELHVESTAPGKAFLNSDTGRTSRWTLDYGADTSFDVDVTGGGTNTDIGVRFLYTDVAGTTVTVTAYETAAAGGSSFAVTSGPVTTSTEWLLFAISSFTGVDMTHLARITFVFNGAEGADHDVDLIQAFNPSLIPAPAALPAGMALLAGLALLRRKRLV